MSDEVINDIPEDSPAYRDWILWEQYVKWCQRVGVKSSLDGYLLWLEERDDE